MLLAFCIENPDAVKNDNEEARLDQRFGRAEAFCIIDSETPETPRVYLNPGKNDAGSAGIGAVQFLQSKEVEGIIAPHLGPKADNARMQLGMKLWHQGDSATLHAAFRAWKQDSLEIPEPPEKTGGLYRA